MASDKHIQEHRSIQIQYGALPYRVTEQGHLEILLITSRGTGRWIIPKGWPMKDRKPAKAAEQEAFEEAGLRGDIGDKPIGTFTYEKFLDVPGVSLPCAVQVFPLRVKRQLGAWPEDSQRRTQWFTAAEAAARVDEADLRALIMDFEAKFNLRKKPESSIADTA
ncbi:MAG TPA: NUDIX hydrolase [Stellaceae bacterium]|jgi:8-oxo-dGTP pyrophosphatase MutT (NUDIX family)|nr:NUDIX hydrolase [Stellaceae bacterium]